ncbi:LysR family transcriptional regulator [Magnetococcus sp. PR-3]|uniref:LysR family transcriptional regulator n=1 Tax=Magnetococcus sp. PR-3 TaxID=3120355 RepID=UPI002FCE3E15
MKHNLNKFDLNLLVAFDTLMTERGVTRAGRALGITQAAMSNTLRRLRELFDDPLFVKTGSSMEPTPRALELSTPVAQALSEVRKALNQEGFDPMLATDLFRIGMIDYASAMLMPGLVNHMSQAAPKSTVRVVDVGGHEEVAHLEKGDVDLVFSRFQWVPPKVCLNRLFSMEYVAVFCPNHPGVEEGELTMDAFLNSRHIHYYPRGMDNTVVDETLAEMGKKRNIIGKLSSFGMLPAMLASSHVMAVMPEGAAKVVARPLGLRVEKLPFKTPALRMALAWHPRTERDPSHVWFRQQIKHVLKEACWRDESNCDDGIIR